jgi:hypothetical protein
LALIGGKGLRFEAWAFSASLSYHLPCFQISMILRFIIYSVDCP